MSVKLALRDFSSILVFEGAAVLGLTAFAILARGGLQKQQLKKTP